MLVYRSNSLEELAAQLFDVVSEPGPALLSPETVLIQSSGMERWLTRELARRGGVAANLQFPFPRAFLRRVMDQTLADPPGEAYEREVLTWHIFEWLADVPDGRPFDAVQNNLRDDPDHQKRLLLAERLAYLFDQYLTYRPRMVLEWEKGNEEQDFQAILWRALSNALGPSHFAHRGRRFLNEASDEQLRAALPSRVSLVGGPGLPPLYLQLLARMGQVVPVHLFVFSVCREYFADLHPPDEVLPEIGEGVHPLLASSGRLGGDFQFALEQIGHYQDGPAKFHLPPETTVLAALQRDLVEGQRRPEERRLPADSVLDPSGRLSDRSITVESCHSRLREVETLKQRLLTWFAEDPSLRPEDVAVLCPNVEEYSPLLTAVFSREGQTNIPYRIADRSEGAENPAARALLVALRLLPGRFKVSQVLDLLQAEPVLARLSIDATGLERIGTWVSQAGVRWGTDPAHKTDYGLPAEPNNTWQAGIERLLLGYARADEDDLLWGDVAPFDDVPAGRGALLGRFVDFCEVLTAARRKVNAGLLHPPAFFRELVVGLVDDLMGGRDAAGGDESPTVTVVRQSVHEVFARIEQAEVTSPLSLASVIHLLEQELDNARPNTEFLTGGITFCALLPLRTIPFRAVCVLGMNQGDFPRTDRAHELDRIAQCPRRGDRSLRNDDRYLFLEILLATRERLSLSYVGRSVQDNSEKPPSVLIEELNQVLTDMIAARDPNQRVVPLAPLVHPLQPFSPRYFAAGGSLLRSLDPEAYRGACALRSARASAPVISPFVARSPSSEEGPAGSAGSSDSSGSSDASGSARERSQGLELEELIRFWKNPADGFLRHLGVRIRDEIESFEDREPIRMNPLSRHIAGQEWLEKILQGESPSLQAAIVRGHLPVGVGGRVACEDLAGDASMVVEVAKGERSGVPRVPCRIALVLPDEAETLLTGTLGDCFGAVRVEVTYGRLNERRLLALWIRHLALCAADSGVECSKLVGRNKDGDGCEVRSIAAVPREQALEYLAVLCNQRRVGLADPLPFLPQVAHAYVQGSSKSVLEGLFKADKALRPSHGEQPRLDPAVEQAFRGRDPLGLDDLPRVRLQRDPDFGADMESVIRTSRFARLADQVFGSMLEFLTREVPTADSARTRGDRS